jgi:LysM repeat protein
MREAHAYLQLPPRPFEKTENVVTSTCGGREEVFKVDQSPTKPGACRAPSRPGGPTLPPTPKPPVFPPRTPEPTATPEITATPEATAAPGPTPSVIQYTVQEGDTMASIAALFGRSEQELRDLNGIHGNQEPKPGDVLKIPIDTGGEPTPGAG